VGAKVECASALSVEACFGDHQHRLASSRMLDHVATHSGAQRIGLPATAAETKNGLLTPQPGIARRSCGISGRMRVFTSRRNDAPCSAPPRPMRPSFLTSETRSGMGSEIARKRNCIARARTLSDGAFPGAVTQLVPLRARQEQRFFQRRQNAISRRYFPQVVSL